MKRGFNLDVDAFGEQPDIPATTLHAKREALDAHVLAFVISCKPYVPSYGALLFAVWSHPSMREPHPCCACCEVDASLDRLTARKLLDKKRIPWRA